MMAVLTVLATALQLLQVTVAFSEYSNEIGEVPDPIPEDPVYLTSGLGVSECTYVRHFGPYSGNISCPDTAPALVTFQIFAIRQSGAGGSSNNNQVYTKWSMQCECPYWSYQGYDRAPIKSSWHPFTISHPNSSYGCSYDEYLSGLAYQYNEQSHNFTWWGRCTRFRGYFVERRDCAESVLVLTDGRDGLFSLFHPMKAVHQVDDYPVQTSTYSLAAGSNKREKRFQECLITPVPGCDNPTFKHGSVTLIRSNYTVIHFAAIDFDSGAHRTTYGDSLLLSCDKGYYVDGPPITTCQINTGWTRLPKCKRCRSIRNCISVECRNGNESFCLKCKPYTDRYSVPLKLVLNENRKKCRMVPYINRTKVITEITFERGDTVRLDCPSLGRPAPTIQWTSFTTNQSVDEIIHEYQRTSYPNGSLAIKYLNDTDEGVYMCTAVNDVGSDSMHISLISREAELRRELQANSSLSAPAILNKSPFMLFFTSETQAFLHCQVTGNPPPTIKWYKLKAEQDEVRSYRVPEYGNLRIKQYDNGTLGFYWIYQHLDWGVYTCMASSKYGSDVIHKYVCVGNSCDELQQTA